ncbi:MAG: hypothetical protein EA394_00415 [Bacteroidia bacterium]|nr:MAG: hypothetical protein EA394_00415 [Bacteroidia bacterium]
MLRRKIFGSPAPAAHNSQQHLMAMHEKHNHHQRSWFIMLKFAQITGKGRTDKSCNHSAKTKKCNVSCGGKQKSP